MDALVGNESWFTNLSAGLYIVGYIVLAGWALARAGRSPLWSLLLLVPPAAVVGIWVFAYARWPRLDGARSPEAGGR